MVGDTSNGARVTSNGGSAESRWRGLRSELEGGALCKTSVMSTGFAEQAQMDGVGASLTNRAITVPCLAQMCPSGVVAVT